MHIVMDQRKAVDYIGANYGGEEDGVANVREAYAILFLVCSMRFGMVRSLNRAMRGHNP
jgi:hypothetical protein